MRLVEEVVATHFAPAWRGLLVRHLAARGLSQTRIARLLGITQSSVSKHLQGKVRPDPRLEQDARLVAVCARVADGLAEGRLTPLDVLAESQAAVRTLADRGPLCAIHEEEMPALLGLGCDLCLVHTDGGVRPEQAVLGDLRGAVRILQSSDGLARWLPHVGTNVARAMDDATDITHVAAIPGGLFVARGAIGAAAPPEFGVSKHVAEILLSVRRHARAQRAALNLAPAEDLLAAARAAGLRVVAVDPSIERDATALSADGAAADLFYHGGAMGIEPQAYLVAEDATSLALRTRDLLTRA